MNSRSLELSLMAISIAIMPNFFLNHKSNILPVTIPVFICNTIKFINIMQWKTFYDVGKIIIVLSTVDSMGRIILAGGAAVGLGALCYYGLGMSNEIGAIEKAV